ncbi:Hypothetical_protein [Hexamita inflata]|uniref:Hypothetical_protein n=1 Tax=Hexamita inflata TaxID=28002 RepID=A0AA86RBK5_9EUKA|nr:Hypothetical protein HINF_LOCUS58556 [Hexamita inflata]
MIDDVNYENVNYVTHFHIYLHNHKISKILNTWKILYFSYQYILKRKLRNGLKLNSHLIYQFYLPLQIRICYSVCYFQKCVHNKLTVLNSVDLYRDFYEGLRAIDCQSVAKAKNEEPKEVELFGWYGNLKK